MLWFRAEEVEIVEWAGNPHKDDPSDVQQILTPRSSFEVWRETVRGRSRRWTAVTPAVNGTQWTWAGTGVLCNCVTPAAAKTELFEQMAPAQIDYMLGKIPMGRFVRVDEIAALACWLATEECSFSTGGVFDISGGRATY